MRFQIIWPERRIVSADTIRGWYKDAVFNHEVVEDSLVHPDDMARELSDVGLITLGSIHR